MLKQISSSDVDASHVHPEAYPPKLLLQATSVVQDPTPITCRVKVRGIADVEEFILSLPEKRMDLTTNSGECLVFYLY